MIFKKASTAIMVAIMFIVAGIAMTTGQFSRGDSEPVAGGSNFAPLNEGPIGSLTNPHLISNATQLNTTVRSNAGSANQHFRLTNHIDLATFANWTPIPSLSTTSSFDGNGFTIRNLTASGGTNIGLFAIASGTVRNLNFENVDITVSGTNGGAVAGQATGTVARFENIRVNSGLIRGSNLTPSLWSSHTLGGVVGGVSSGNIHFENVFNATNISGQYFVGGILGHVTGSSTTVRVFNAMNTGTMRGYHHSFGYIGGIVGLNEGSANLTIDTAVNTGTVYSARRDTGGILGAAWSGHVTIRNAINNSHVTTAQGTVGSITTRQGATLIVQNSWFNNSFPPNVLIAPNQTNSTVHQSGPVSNAVMHSPQFIDDMNERAGAPIFVWGPNGPEIVTLADRLLFTFNANGGVFANDETVIHESWDVNHEFVPGDVSQPTRTGFTFGGWNTMANGSGDTVIFTGSFFGTMNRAVYAQWNKITYTVEVVNLTMAGDQQSTRVHDVYPGPSRNTVTIYDTGFARTYFSGSVDPARHFISWMALLNTGNDDVTDMDNWVNIGSGEVISGGNTHEHRLPFYSDGEFLINSNFIEMFEDDLVITIKAYFSNTPPMNVNFDAGTTDQRDFGTIRVNGTARPLNASLNVSFPFGHTAPMVLEVTPNQFRTLVSVVHGGTTVLAASMDYEDGVYSMAIPVSNLLDVRVNFGTHMFDFVVEASNPAAGAGVQGFDPMVTNQIGLGSDNLYNSGISLSSVPPNFRLVSPSANNVRIWNRNTLEYDYFSAIGGNISFTPEQLDENFFYNYVQDNTVRIIAAFVQQFDISVATNDATMGRFNVVIIEPTGTRHENPDLSRTFDENSQVTITIEPTEGVEVGGITGADGFVNATNDLISFNLSENMDINIQFVVRSFNMSVIATDMDGRAIDSTIIETDASHTTLSVPTTITNINFVEHIEGLYDFVGWFAMVEGEPVPLFWTGDTITNITFNQTFAEDFADGFFFRVVAMFERIHSIEFEVIGDGDFVAQQLHYVSGEWVVDTGAAEITDTGVDHEFAVGTRFLITATADEFFQFSEIDGLVSGEEITGNSVVVIVDGRRFISIVFVPQQITITTTVNVRGNGSMETGQQVVQLGDVILLTFNPSSGFELSNWTINGQPISNLADVTISGNTVRITITNDVLTHLRANNYTFNSTIETTMNRTFMFGMLAALIVIPLIALFITWVMVSNARRKKQYAALMQKRQQGSVMMGQSDALKKLREDMNK